MEIAKGGTVVFKIHVGKNETGEHFNTDTKTLEYTTNGKGERGLNATIRFGMLPLKLRHIQGCLAFSECFFWQKKDPTPVKSLFENTMEIKFFIFFDDQNTPEKNLIM